MVPPPNTFAKDSGWVFLCCVQSWIFQETSNKPCAALFLLRLILSVLFSCNSSGLLPRLVAVWRHMEAHGTTEDLGLDKWQTPTVVASSEELAAPASTHILTFLHCAFLQFLQSTCLIRWHWLWDFSPLYRLNRRCWPLQKNWRTCRPRIFSYSTSDILCCNHVKLRHFVVKH